MIYIHYSTRIPSRCQARPSKILGECLSVSVIPPELATKMLVDLLHPPKVSLLKHTILVVSRLVIFHDDVIERLIVVHEVAYVVNEVLVATFGEVHAIPAVVLLQLGEVGTLTFSHVVDPSIACPLERYDSQARCHTHPSAGFFIMSFAVEGIEIIIPMDSIHSVSRPSHFG